VLRNLYPISRSRVVRICPKTLCEEWMNLRTFEDVISLLWDVVKYHDMNRATVIEQIEEARVSGLRRAVVKTAA
jgi:hypothetical protein